MSDRNQLKTFILLEHAHIATVDRTNKMAIAIDATDEMLNGMDENSLAVQYTYNNIFGCYKDTDRKTLTAIIFLSPVLAEIVKLSENALGNSYEVVEANPEILSTIPVIHEMAVSIGALTESNKILRHSDGSIVLNRNVSLSNAELQEYMQTANLPASYLARLKLEAPHTVISRYSTGERASFSSSDVKAVSKHLFEDIASNSIQEDFADADGVNPY